MDRRLPYNYTLGRHDRQGGARYAISQFEANFCGDRDRSEQFDNRNLGDQGRSQQSANSFTPFPKLPTELRLQVWDELISVRTITDGVVPKKTSQLNIYPGTVQANYESRYVTRAWYRKYYYHPNYVQPIRYLAITPYSPFSTHLDYLRRDRDAVSTTNFILPYREFLNDLRILHLSGCICDFRKYEEGETPFERVRNSVTYDVDTRNLEEHMFGFLRNLETVKVMITYHSKKNMGCMSGSREEQRYHQNVWGPAVEECLDRIFRNLQKRDNERSIPSIKAKVFYVGDEAECGKHSIHVAEDQFH